MNDKQEFMAELLLFLIGVVGAFAKGYAAGVNNEKRKNEKKDEMKGEI